MPLNNNTIDDNFYEHEVKNIKYTIKKEYKFEDFISRGYFGSVILVTDVKTNEKVAIKKVLNPFVNYTSARRAFREFSILKLHNHKNIIKFIDAYAIPNRNSFDLYFVTEYMPQTLESFVKNQSKSPIDQKRISFILFQLLCGVNHLKQMGVIHRDLKPSNIMLDDKDNLKIIDFGLSRKRATGNFMTVEVLTQYYRSPENIVCLHESERSRYQEMKYDSKSDVWSIGCIFAELILQRIFLKGTSNWNQMKKIVLALGHPNKNFMGKIGFEWRKDIEEIPNMGEVDFKMLFPDEFFEGGDEKNGICASNARNLLSLMLKIDPTERCLVEEALNHEYVKSWHENNELLLNSEPHKKFKNDVEDEFGSNIVKWKEYVVKEIGDYEKSGKKINSH